MSCLLQTTKYIRVSHVIRKVRSRKANKINFTTKRQFHYRVSLSFPVILTQWYKICGPVIADSGLVRIWEKWSLLLERKI